MYVSMATLPLIRIEVKRLQTEPNPIPSQYCLPLCEPDRAKDEIHAFLSDPGNEVAMSIRFEKLAANVEMAASDETAAREKALSSVSSEHSALARAGEAKGGGDIVCSAVGPRRIMHCLMH